MLLCFTQRLPLLLLKGNRSPGACADQAVQSVATVLSLHAAGWRHAGRLARAHRCGSGARKARRSCRLQACAFGWTAERPGGCGERVQHALCRPLQGGHALPLCGDCAWPSARATQVPAPSSVLQLLLQAELDKLLEPHALVSVCKRRESAKSGIRPAWWPACRGCTRRCWVEQGLSQTQSCLDQACWRRP